MNGDLARNVNHEPNVAGDNNGRPPAVMIPQEEDEIEYLGGRHLRQEDQDVGLGRGYASPAIAMNLPQPPPAIPIHNALAHYEAQMRDHAAAFANAAAGAAWAAAQLANNIQHHMHLQQYPPIPCYPEHDSVDHEGAVEGGAEEVPARQRHREEEHQAQPNKRRPRIQYEPMAPQPQPLYTQAQPHPNYAQYFPPSPYDQFHPPYHAPSPLFSIMEASSVTVYPYSMPSPMQMQMHGLGALPSQAPWNSQQAPPMAHQFELDPLYNPEQVVTGQHHDGNCSDAMHESANSPFSVRNHSNNKRRYNQSSYSPRYGYSRGNRGLDNTRNNISLENARNNIDVPQKHRKPRKPRGPHEDVQRHNYGKVHKGPLVTFVGKTGVAALHELCSKQHWESLRFVEMSSSSPANSQASKASTKRIKSKVDDDGSAEGCDSAFACPVEEAASASKLLVADLNDKKRTSNLDANCRTVKRKSLSSVSSACSAVTTPTVAPLNSHEFLISAVVNGTTYAPGRGGTKAAARQDASRKALFSLLPGILFDDNGVVASMPPTKSDAQEENNNIQPDFSRLAIDSSSATAGGGGGNQSDSSSALSIATSSVASSTARRAHNIVGSASYGGYYGGPSSGISSASEDDADSYYASRGASVCSTLLHAMWQIDETIRDPPHYAYDVIMPKVKDDKGRNNAKSFRSSFSCTVSLLLHKKVAVLCDNDHVEEKLCSEHDTIHESLKNAEEDLVPDKAEHELQECNEAIVAASESHCQDSKSDSEQSNFNSNADDVENLAVVKGVKKLKLDDAGSEARPNSDTGNNSNLSETADLDATAIAKSDLSRSEYEKLEAVGTGATKREAKHVASAKLLAILFPECDGTAKVIAAAEAAREAYAAQKALIKRKHSPRLSTLETKPGCNPNRRQSPLCDTMKELGCSIPDEMKELEDQDNSCHTAFDEPEDREAPCDTALCPDNLISVAKLSISESKTVGTI